MRCKICGKEFNKKMYYEPICSYECFLIDYWNKALDETAIIIDGICYHDGGFVENPYKYAFLGHAGRIFKIHMNDGRKFITNNLWYQGEIPANRNIKDNARFVTLEENINELERLF